MKPIALKRPHVYTYGDALIVIHYIEDAPVWGQWESSVFMDGVRRGMYLAESRARALIRSRLAVHDFHKLQIVHGIRRGEL